MEKISVFLADWQVLFREGIHFTLSGEEDIEVIGEAANNKEALDFIENNPPKVAVLNANRDKFSGIAVTRRIRQNLLPVAVVLIMDSDDDEQLFSALMSGARACLNKDASPSDLIDIIREVAQGKYPIGEALLKPALAAKVLAEFEVFSLINKQVDNLLAHLSPKETELLHFIAEGNSIEQANQTLGINEQAVKHLLGSTLTKLVANDHHREVIEATQSSLAPITRRAGKPAPEYITKEEFNAFKQSVMERLKSFLSELS